MNLKTIALAAAVVSCGWGQAFADAAGDLSAGRAALAAGDVPKALPLLESAAQALPQSVEAQLELARAYLQTGQFDKALAQYRAVLKLSPDHAEAKRLSEALTGQARTFDQKLANARALMDVGLFDLAINPLRGLVQGPYDPSQRLAARMALAEAALWQSFGVGMLAEATQAANDAKGTPSEPVARVIAAMMLASSSQPEHKTAAADMLKAAGNLPAPWKQRAELVDLVLKLDEKTAADISGKLAGPLAACPSSPYRGNLTAMLAQEMCRHIRQADMKTALAIAWPMLAKGAAPAAPTTVDIVGKIDLTGGWLWGSIQRVDLTAVVEALRTISRNELQARGSDATLVGHALAGELCRGLPEELQGQPGLVLWMGMVEELGMLSRPAVDRKKGETLSVADDIQRTWMLPGQLGGRLTDEGQRARLVGALIGQIMRYEQAGDLEAGLKRFVTLVEQRGPGAPILDCLPVVEVAPGPALIRELLFLADKHAAVGQQVFAKAAAAQKAQPDILSTNRADQIAVVLYRKAAALNPQDPKPAAEAGKIADRYAAADRWGEAEAVLAMFYKGAKGDDGRWAAARLKVRQGLAAEDKRLAARHKLPDALDPLVAAALKTVTDILKADSGEANKSAAVALAAGLIGRYQSLDRHDLAEAVIAAMTPQGVDALADWALLARADLLADQGMAALALVARQFDGAGKPPLTKEHAAELKLLGELLDRFGDSVYAPVAVERVGQVVGAYQAHKAFDVAAQVLADFVKARPPIRAAEALTYRRAGVLLAKASGAFADRPDKDNPPAGLSAEYAAAIDALAAFLKDHPSGPYSPAALNELSVVARAYGQAGAWSVAREVLKRFAAAVPDFRQPELLKLMEAGTYLGELDKAHGLSLLVLPTPPTRGRFLGEVSGVEVALEDSLTGAVGGRLRSVAELPATAPAAPSPAPSAVASALERNARFSGYYDDGRKRDAREAPDLALAMIRQSEQQQSRRIALMNEPQQAQRQQQGAQGQPGQGGPQQLEVVLPAGAVLSEAEIKRQDAAADAAYAILIELVKARTAGGESVVRVAEQARAEILWLIGFFEGQLRSDRAVTVIERFLTDQPTDPARVALSYRTLTDRLVWAAQRQPADKIDQAWVDARHELFQAARKAIDDFLKQYAAPAHKDWLHRARLLTVDSYEQEAHLAAAVSAARAGGLLARAADELLALADAQPDHPQAGGFPQRLWNIANRLVALGQRDQAVYVFSRLPTRFPTDAMASQAVLQIAQLYAANLSVPLRAVETYQEYLALVGDNEPIRSQILSIAQQLAARQRYLEALHIYGVFVDCFPTDPRAPQALLAVGQTHQANEAWTDAKDVYQRILEEYPSHAVVGRVRLAMAECEIQLSNWKAARRIYEEYVQRGAESAMTNQVPAQPSGQQGAPAVLTAAAAQERIEVLKSLDRYQTLLADAQITRNKDDAQFQIGRIVLERLSNRVKAIGEFAKVLKDYPKSDQADDAQFEIGKALLALGRLEEARAALLKVPADYPTSPLADDALYLVGKSYEQQAAGLAAVTLEKARGVAFEAGQRGAYQEFQKQQSEVGKARVAFRDELRKAGKSKELEMDEAYSQFRYNFNVDPNVKMLARRAEQEAETESALEVANRQDRINDAYRQAVAVYARAAKDYPLGTATSETLMRMAEIYEVHLKDRASAMNTYQQIVKVFPGTPVAENAAWKVVKFYEQEGKFAEAVNAYRDFIRNYPASSRVAEAQYAMAEALEQLGRWVEAMDAYQVFREKFTSHPKARMAEEQIQWIKAYRK